MMTAQKLVPGLEDGLLSLALAHLFNYCDDRTRIGGKSWK
jgi:hypothetical protein